MPLGDEPVTRQELLERGGILDDVIVSRYEDHWGVVCNASNRTVIVSWLEQHKPAGGVEIRDRTLETLMVAVQGPAVIPKPATMLPLPIADLKLVGQSSFRMRYRYREVNGQLVAAAPQSGNDLSFNPSPSILALARANTTNR